MSKKIILPVFAGCALVLSLVLLLHFYHREKTLHGLLVDLELEGPDSSRYGQLRDALEKRIPREVEFLHNHRVTIDYAHFGSLTIDALNGRKIDFLVLSPQSTPWYRYEGAAGRQLDILKQFVRDAAVNRNLPMLGICGGHQFLALAFGGSVGFIDPALAGTNPERYPKSAVAERGVVFLQTLGDDPILSGVAGHPGQFRAVESHYEEVKRVPAPFVNFAESELSPAQLMRIPGKTVYGLAFHPERCWDEADCDGAPVAEGRRILANFLLMVSGSTP